MNDNRKTRPATRRRDVSSPDRGRALVSVPIDGSAATDDSTYDSTPISGAAVHEADGFRRLTIVPATDDSPGLRRTENPRVAASAVVAPRFGMAVIGPVRRLSSPLSTKNAGDLGLVTHLLVSTHAPLLASGLPADLLARMTEMALALLAANSNRRRVLAAEAVSLASRYLNALAPRTPWRLLGVEHETGNGPVDVAWMRDEDGRVLFDELKTSRIASRKVPQHWTEQVRRYAAAGATTHEAAFAGVRLLPLNRPDLARLVDPDGRIRPLTPTPENPLHVTGDPLMTPPKAPSPEQHTPRPTETWVIDHTELPVWSRIPDVTGADDEGGPVLPVNGEEN